MDWAEDVAVLEVARVEAQPPVVLLELARAQDAVMDRLARAEVLAWGPTYRVIRK
jgi:hypothetical protein